MNEQTNNDKSKLGLALLITFAATALLWVGKLNGPEWVSTITWVTAAYMLGQVGAVLAQGWTTSVIAKTQSAAK